MGEVITKLKARHRVFVNEYLRDQHGANAAIRAGYAAHSASNRASQLLAREDVRREIDRKLKEMEANLGFKAEDVLRRLWEVGNVDIANAFNESGGLRPIHDIPVETRRAIAAIDEDELFEGLGRDRQQVGVTKKIKFHQKVEALVALGKYFKLFTEKVELTDNTDLAEKIRKGRERLANARKRS